MKAVGQNYRRGDIRVLDVDAPALKPGGILVRSEYSVISAGTEGMKVREGKMSYLGMARTRPDQVKKVLATVRQQGILAAYQKVMNKLDSLTPLGYSVSGHVIAVAEGAEEFAVGQRVACAGAGYANHAEVNFVPRQLAVPVPENVPMRHAAFTTIGSIALQGFRQSELRLGETACVIGLGLIGQILLQILTAAGVRVIGMDVLEDRCRLAADLGAAWAGSPDDPNLAMTVRRLTSGIGADCVFICASDTTSRPVEMAAEIARDRARVVDIGKTHLDLPWKEYYEKEMDLRFSRSYGPGRYDRSYEEQGVDYPVGYVRWTERRNMAAFLDLLSSGKVRLDPLISMECPFEEAEDIFESMAAGQTRGLGVVFSYQEETATAEPTPPRPPKAASSGRVRLGVIGAGNYAGSMLLPLLAGDREVQLVHVVTSTGLTAKNAADKFGFTRAGTDSTALLTADDVDAVLIATRHTSHPALVAQALRAGKAVFVEKPLAIDLPGLECVRTAIAESGNDRLLVGFNRRFSPCARRMEAIMDASALPLVFNYRVHAGQVEGRSWYADPSEGTRFISEGGHFLDFFAFLFRSHPVTVMAACLRPPSTVADDTDNVAVTVTYANGSVGTLLYLTQGSAALPKEWGEVIGGGRTVQLHNFEYLKTYIGSRCRQERIGARDKGQAEELRAFVRAVKDGSPMPIPFESLDHTTLATLAVPESLRTGGPVLLDDLRNSA